MGAGMVPVDGWVLFCFVPNFCHYAIAHLVFGVFQAAATVIEVLRNTHGCKK